MNKNKKIIIFIVILVLLVGLILLFVQKNKDKEVSQITNETISSNKTENTGNEYDEKMNELYEIETNNQQEEIIINIIDTETEDERATMNITNKDIEYIEILSATNGKAKEKAIENKIYAREAIKMGITLSQDTIEEIEDIANSDKIISSMQGDESSKSNFKKKIYTYLTELKYKKELNDKILYEIDNDKISIKNKTINNKMREYNNTKNNFKKNENPTDEEKKSYLSEIANSYYEIKNLYLDAIKDKYVIEYLQE